MYCIQIRSGYLRICIAASWLKPVNHLPQALFCPLLVEWRHIFTLRHTICWQLTNSHYEACVILFGSMISIFLTQGIFSVYRIYQKISCTLPLNNWFYRLFGSIRSVLLFTASNLHLNIGYHVFKTYQTTRRRSCFEKSCLVEEISK